MLCPTEKGGQHHRHISLVDWRVARVGVLLRLCGQGLRSRSPCSRAEVDFRRVYGEKPGVDVFGTLHTGAGPRGSCPQGHGLHY